MGRRAALIGLGASAVVGGAGFAVRRQTRAWRAADDAVGPDPLDLPDGESITVTTGDGAHLAVTVAGEGPTVVLAHGFTDTRAVWAPVARRLIASGHRVVLYDQRGHGASTAGSEDMDVARIGDDLLELLEALDVHHAVLAGHSMGGMTLMALVGGHPDVVAGRVAAVVLVSTAAYLSGRVGMVDAWYARALGSGIATRATAGRAGPLLVRRTVGRRPRYSHLAARASTFAATPAETRRAYAAAMQAIDLRAGLSAWAVPATIVVGSRDRLTPAAYGRAIAAAIPGASLVEIADAGHMLPLEEPDQVATLIASATRPPAQRPG